MATETEKNDQNKLMTSIQKAKISLEKKAQKYWRKQVDVLVRSAQSVLQTKELDLLSLASEMDNLNDPLAKNLALSLRLADEKDKYYNS